MSDRLGGKMDRRIRSRRFGLSNRVVKGSHFRLQFEQLEVRLALASDWQNPLFNLDVDDNGVVSAFDAISIINRLNLVGVQPLAGPVGDNPYFDVDGNGISSAFDAIGVINELNAPHAKLASTLQLANDSGASATDKITSDGTVTGLVALPALPFQTAKYRINRGPVQDFVINPDGTFSVGSNSLLGDVRLTIFATDGSSRALQQIRFTRLSANGPIYDSTRQILLRQNDRAPSQITLYSPDNSGNPLFQDTDLPIGDALTFQVSSSREDLAQATISGTLLKLTYSPASLGRVEFQIVATDRLGNVTTGQLICDLTNLPPNRVPQVVGEVYSTNEDSPLVIPKLTGTLANDTDIDGDTLSTFIVTGTSHGTLALAADGAFEYTPNLNYFGADEFTYAVTDGITNALGVTQLTILPVNDSPSIVASVFLTDDDVPIIRQAVDGLISIVADVEGDPITVSMFSQAQHGTAVISADGAFTYLPDADYSGDDSFTFTASDGINPPVAATANISVQARNTAPTATDLHYYIDEDGVLSVDALHGVLSTSFDADGDSLLLTGFQRPNEGKWDYFIDGSFTYTPKPNFHGDDFFLYSAVDDDGNATDQYIGTLTVRSIFDPPVLQSDVRDTGKNADLQISGPGDLFINDTFNDVDAPQLQILSGPTHGAILSTIGENGQQQLIYRPNLNFLGNDSITYGISDGTNTYGQAVVSISVTPRGKVIYDGTSQTVFIYGTEDEDYVQIQTQGAPVDSSGNLLSPAALQNVLVDVQYADQSITRRYGDIRHIVFRGYKGNDSLAIIYLDVLGGFDIVADGGDGSDSLSGAGGNDQLVGGKGEDILRGGAGDDYIAGMDGEDYLNGSMGNDRLYGGEGPDSLYGGSGADILRGENGNDDLTGDGIDEQDSFYDQFSQFTHNPGNDDLDGGLGNDFLRTDEGTNHLDGGSGDDRFVVMDVGTTAQSNNVLVDAIPDGQNPPTMTTTLDYSLFGRPIVFYGDQTVQSVGDNIIIDHSALQQLQTIIGGAGDDLIKCSPDVFSTIYGGAGNDNITGGNRPDLLYGGPGNDLIYGGRGNDIIDGGTGTNDAYGGPGEDEVANATERDSQIQVVVTNTRTRFGSKFIYVTITATDDGDKLEITNSGSEYVFYVTPKYKNPGSLTDMRTIDSAGAYLTFSFHGGNGDDLYVDYSDGGSDGGTAYGGGGDDLLFGGRGSDTLYGNDGRDVLNGGPAVDSLYGGIGADRLIGGPGNDDLHGGYDSDTYAYFGTDGFEVDRYREDDSFDDGTDDVLDFSGADQGALLTLPPNIERFVGSAYHDIVHGTAQANSLSGGGGNDELYGEGGDDVLDGGEGADKLVGGSGSDNIFGRDGANRLYGDFEDSDSFEHVIPRTSNYIAGGDQADYILGGNGPDTIYGMGGADYINGLESNDRLYGGDGNDSLYGGDGDDRILGGAGNDSMHGDEGRDYLYNDSSTAWNRPTLIVAVHGFTLYHVSTYNYWYGKDGGDPGFGSQIAQGFEAAGSSTKTMVIDWDSTSGANSYAVDQVAIKIDNFLRAQDEPWDVFLVGHSRGGVFVGELSTSLRANSNLGNVTTVMLDPTAVGVLGDMPTGSRNLSVTKLYDDQYIVFPGTLDGREVMSRNAGYQYVSVRGVIDTYKQEHSTLWRELIGAEATADSLRNTFIAVASETLSWTRTVSDFERVSTLLPFVEAAVDPILAHFAVTDWYLSSNDFRNDVAAATRNKGFADNVEEGSRLSDKVEWLAVPTNSPVTKGEDVLAMLVTFPLLLAQYYNQMPIDTAQRIFNKVMDVEQANPIQFRTVLLVSGNPQVVLTYLPSESKARLRDVVNQGFDGLRNGNTAIFREMRASIIDGLGSGGGVLAGGFQGAISRAESWLPKSI